MPRKLPDRTRWSSRTIGLCLLATALVALLVLFARATPEQNIAHDATPPPFSVRAPTPPLPTAETAPPQPVSGDTAAQMEICGYGQTIDPGASTFMEDLRVALDRPQALEQAVAELAASAQASDRAVALQYEVVLSTQKALDATLDGTSGCRSNERCQAAARRQASLAAAPLVQTLARLADQSVDPVAFSIAYNTCLKTRDNRPAECANITAQRWASIEPENGAPWLLVAAEAALRGDEAARLLAVARAADAQRFDHYGAALLRPATSTTLREASLLDRLATHVAMTGVFAAVPQGSYAEALAFCRPEALAQHWSLCERLAARLVENDATVLGPSVGRRIGERLGWSADRLAALKDEQDAMEWAHLGGALQMEQMLSCASLANVERRNLAIAQRGEREALRGEIVRAGVPVATLARRYRDFIASRRMAAAATTRK